MNATDILNAAIDEWMKCYGISGAEYEYMTDDTESRAWLARIALDNMALDMRTMDGVYYPCLVEAW